FLEQLRWWPEDSITVGRRLGERRCSRQIECSTHSSLRRTVRRLSMPITAAQGYLCCEAEQTFHGSVSRSVHGSGSDCSGGRCDGRRASATLTSATGHCGPFLAARSHQA